MIDQNTDFFKIEDNFAKTAHIQSIPIFEAKIDFVPKITIAIPTYKRADLLKEALESAINQTDFNDYEIIVVDNNPERGCDTETMMLNYQNRRVSYYKNVENIGMFGNWNRCIELARGEYITILNDDDLLSSLYLERVSKFISEINYNFNVLLVSLSHFRQIEDIDKIVSTKKFKNKTKYREIQPIELLEGNINPGSLGVLFKVSSLRYVGGYNSKYYPTSDYVLWLNFLLFKLKIVRLEELLGYYRTFVNESLKVQVQIKNIENDRVLRENIVKLFSLPIRILISKSKPLIDYRHYKKVSLYSSEFKQLYGSKILEIKKSICLYNYFTYFFIKLYTKIKITSEFFKLYIMINSLKKKVLSKFGVFLSNMLFIYRKRLKEKSNKSKIKLVYFAGEKSINYLNASLNSVYKNWYSVPEVVIISDGTDKNIFVASMINWPEKIDIIDWTVCADYFKEKGNGQLYNYANNELWGKKLVGIFYCFEHWNTLYTDTDVLWFKDPTNTIPDLNADSTSIKMSQDVENYFSDKMIEEVCDNTIKMTPLNAGVIYGHGDFSKFEMWNKLCNYLEKYPDNRTEQTTFAILTTNFGSCWNMDQIYIGLNDFTILPCNKELYKRIIARHYVNYKSWLFWRDYIIKIL